MVGYAFHYKNRIALTSTHALSASTEKNDKSYTFLVEGEEHKIEVDKEEVQSGNKKRLHISGSRVAVAAPWLESLLRREFFGLCEEHKDLRKSEVNMYCIECKQCMCPHCLAMPSCHHIAHRRLQIRRYVYQDVIRIHDMQQLVDCSKVQPYTVNSAKVVLLKPRKKSKPSKPNPTGPTCEICSQSITEPNRYCSIACKVTKSLEITDLGGHGTVVNDKSDSFLSHLTLDDDEKTCQQEEDASFSFSSESSNSECEGNPCHPPSKRMRTRKGNPQRAPFH